MLIFVVVVVAIALFVIAMYNGLVGLKVRADNAWSDIDVQLKRRHDLIPNLVETVRGYAGHERETLEAVVEARNRAAAAQGPAATGEAERALAQARCASSSRSRRRTRSSRGRELHAAPGEPRPRSRTRSRTRAATTTPSCATSTPGSSSSPRTSSRARSASPSANSSSSPTRPSGGAEGRVRTPVKRSATASVARSARARARRALCGSPPPAAPARSRSSGSMPTIAVEPGRHASRSTETITRAVHRAAGTGSTARSRSSTARRRGSTGSLRLELLGSTDERRRAARGSRARRERHYLKYKIWVPGAVDATPHDRAPLPRPERTPVLRGPRRALLERDRRRVGRADRGRVRAIALPAGATGIRATAFTGAYGSTAREARRRDEAARRSASRMPQPLGFREGLTAVVGWDKGLVAEPGATERGPGSSPRTGRSRSRSWSSLAMCVHLAPRGRDPAAAAGRGPVRAAGGTDAGRGRHADRRLGRHARHHRHDRGSRGARAISGSRRRRSPRCSA